MLIFICRSDFFCGGWSQSLKSNVADFSLFQQANSTQLKHNNYIAKANFYHNLNLVWRCVWVHEATFRIIVKILTDFNIKLSDQQPEHVVK